MRISAICLRLCLGLGTSLTCASARAKPDWIVGRPAEELRFTDLSFGTAFDGGHGFGLSPGIHLGIPVLDEGFIPPLNDSFYLEPGFLLSARFRPDAPDLIWAIPELGPRWNFHLTPNWDAFASIKIGWAIGREGDFWARGTVGTLWWFGHRWALRLETGYGALIGQGAYMGLSYRFI